MSSNPNARLNNLLRYTYRGNMVFFAGFATWYVLKGPDRKESAGDALEQKKIEGPVTKQ
ncbi:hypothetical protein EJ02DRAFT_457586 [Clathrospora elynae]|uniref:Uncharacterized protein n=1 Tax=Clathrospora elynae TaxID=706981 RepID=A0A6A5SFI1_9PLEO|nr:hypothetical protein EJ02DRAFT_457586 [Clathrospora elynae]